MLGGAVRIALTHVKASAIKPSALSYRRPPVFPTRRGLALK